MKKIALTLIEKIKKTKPRTFFWIIIIVLSFIYNINQTISSRPVGIHQWRNCISAGYALNYYHGAAFLEPSTEVYLSENFESNVILLEFPLLYYAVGQIYKIFGPHEFLFRLTNLLIGFLGLYYLFKMSRKYLDNTLYSLALPIILFSSTVYIFYINNFITDATGISLALFGFYFFFRFYESGNYSNLLISMFIFALAGLLKLQALYLYFALFGIYIVELVFRFNFGKDKQKLFTKQWLSLAYFIMVLVLVASWYLYASEYAETHNTAIHYSNKYKSIYWNLDPELREHIWNEFVHRFKKGYLHSPNFIYFSFIIFLHNLIFIKRHNRLLNGIILFSLFQIVFLNILFYESIGRCDYYHINSFVFILFIYLNLFLYLKNNYPKVYKSKYLFLAVAIGSIFLISRGYKGITDKYSDYFHWDTSKTIHKCGYITPYLRNLGIEREDRVYYTPDPSQNISLYMMDQLGNTDISLGGTFKDKVNFLKGKGLQYIMIGNTDSLNVYKSQVDYLNDSTKVGEFNGVHIFKVITE
jgi:hypothetical protein